jgi:hypothetical protein
VPTPDRASIEIEKTWARFALPTLVLAGIITVRPFREE